MTAAAHTEEFRRLFGQEAETRLESLSSHLLQLEEAGSDDALIATVFRDAHNLKGGAAVVGFDDVARVAHAMEDLLEQVRDAAREVTPELIDVLLAATDGLMAIVPAILAGEDRAADADALERRLRRFTEPGKLDSDGALKREPPPAAAARPAGRAGRDGDTPMMVPLSQLDEMLRLVGESVSATLRLGRLMSERWKADPESVPEFRDLSRALKDLREGTTRARMVPISTITDSLHRAVRDLARSLGKNVRWEVRGGETEIDRSVLQQLSDPLLHLVRNAVDHAVETPAERSGAGKPEQATLLLQVRQVGSEVTIEFSDDGRGIDLPAVREEAWARGTDVSTMGDEESLRMVFESGLSTAQVISDVSGRGVGLDAVRAGVEAIRGRIEVHSSPSQGTLFRIAVPITLAVLSCLLVEVGQERYAIPMHLVVVAQAAKTVGSDTDALGRPTVWVGDSHIRVSGLARTLWGDDRADSGEVVVVVGATRRHAFLVDRLVGQRDVVVKDLGPLLSGLDAFAGASVEPDGSILLVLDVAGLVARARR